MSFVGTLFMKTVESRKEEDKNEAKNPYNSRAHKQWVYFGGETKAICVFMYTRGGGFVRLFVRQNI